MVDDIEDASFVFNGRISSLIENAAHLTVTLRRAWAVVYARALFRSRTCPHPRAKILGGSEGRSLGTHLGNNLLRRIHSQPRDLGQSLHGILVLAEHTRQLLVQLADLLLDQLQIRQRHLY